MAVTITSSVGTSMADATGNSSQNHLVYAANQGAWWLFYLSSTQSMSALYSTNFSTWSTPTNSPLTLAYPHYSMGRSFGFCYKNIASTDVLHMGAGYQNTGTPPQTYPYASRFTLGTTWTNTNAESLLQDPFATGTVGQAAATVQYLDSNNLPWEVTTYTGSNQKVYRDDVTNTDSGSSWAGFVRNGTTYSLNNYWNCPLSGFMGNLGSGSSLWIMDNGYGGTGTFTMLAWAVYASGAMGSTTQNFLASGVTTTAANNWSACTVSTTDTHVVALSDNAKAFVHRRYNGSSVGNGQSIPSLANNVNTHGGLALISDGTDAWLFTIDVNNNVLYIKWTAATPAWDAAWTQLEAGGSSARNYITACYGAAANAIGVVWTQANGSNYDIVGSTLSFAPPVVYTEDRFHPVFWSPTRALPSRFVPY